MSEPAPGVILFVEKGYLSAAFVEKIVGVYDSIAARAERRPHIFVDCEFMVGYDPPIRADITACIQKHRTRLGSVHMLVRSRLAKMGLAVSNLVLGGLMHGYTQRDVFQAALSQAVARTHPGSPRLLFAVSRAGTA